MTTVDRAAVEEVLRGLEQSLERVGAFPSSRPPVDGARIQTTMADMAAMLVKYSPDQPRDEHGRWTAGGGGGIAEKPTPPEPVDARVVVPKLRRVKDRVWSGGVNPPLESDMSSQDTGKVAENIALAYLRQFEGHKDAEHANVERKNYPVDLQHNHEVIEVKGGRSDNTRGARRWRLTFQTTDREQELGSKMTPDQWATYNRDKSADILVRKQAAMDELSRRVGRPVQARTVTAIVNPDRRVADLFSFQGFDKEIAWTSAKAKKGFIGTFSY
jgi:hypothetical protein